MPKSVPSLEVRNLKTQFHTEDGLITAVDDIGFSVDKGKTIGIVGESGCGKSVTSLSIMGLIPSPPGEIVAGEIYFNGKNLLSYSESEMRRIRGNEIAMIFQEPMTSLNPVFTIGRQIAEVLEIHRPEMSSTEVKDRVLEMLRLVGIPEPKSRYNDYPHQLSGGMRQRVMIAMALACDPQVLIADEPTTALDVTIQAQILELMKRLQKELSMAMILITHDLGVVAETCDDVLVMYAGRVVEYGNVEDIFYRPKHRYTQGLLQSIPHFESGQRLKKLKTIPGLVPNLNSLPQGCRFQDRCRFVEEDCRIQEPELTPVSATHRMACYHPNNEETM